MVAIHDTYRNLVPTPHCWQVLGSLNSSFLYIIYSVLLFRICCVSRFTRDSLIDRFLPFVEGVRSHFGSRAIFCSDAALEAVTSGGELQVYFLCPRTHEDVALLILLLEMGWLSSQQSWNAGSAQAYHSWWTEQQWWQCGICSGWTGEAKKKCPTCGCKRTWAQQSVASELDGKQGTNLVGSRGLEIR